MNTTDIELARLVYLISALGTVLFTSMLCRWLWRPLRFLLLAATFSLLFTPFYIDQTMPDEQTQNIVPAFVVMIYDVVNDREHWQQAIRRAGQAIVTVGGILGVIALGLAILMPKPAKAPKNTETSNTAKPPKTTRALKKNPYLPEDFQETA